MTQKPSQDLSKHRVATPRRNCTKTPERTVSPNDWAAKRRNQVEKAAALRKEAQLGQLTEQHTFRPVTRPKSSERVGYSVRPQSAVPIPPRREATDLHTARRCSPEGRGRRVTEPPPATIAEPCSVSLCPWMPLRESPTAGLAAIAAAAMRRQGVATPSLQRFDCNSSSSRTLQPIPSSSALEPLSEGFEEDDESGTEQQGAISEISMVSPEPDEMQQSNTFSVLQSQLNDMSKEEGALDRCGQHNSSLISLPSTSSLVSNASSTVAFLQPRGSWRLVSGVWSRESECQEDSKPERLPSPTREMPNLAAQQTDAVPCLQGKGPPPRKELLGTADRKFESVTRFSWDDDAPEYRELSPLREDGSPSKLNNNLFQELESKAIQDSVELKRCIQDFHNRFTSRERENVKLAQTFHVQLSQIRELFPDLAAV